MRRYVWNNRKGLFKIATKKLFANSRSHYIQPKVVTQAVVQEV